MKTNLQVSKEWEKSLRKLIENWKYEAGDDVLASVLADEVIEEVELLFRSDHARIKKEVLKYHCGEHKKLLKVLE